MGLACQRSFRCTVDEPSAHHKAADAPQRKAPTIVKISSIRHSERSRVADGVCRLATKVNAAVKLPVGTSLRPLPFPPSLSPCPGGDSP